MRKALMRISTSLTHTVTRCPCVCRCSRRLLARCAGLPANALRTSRGATAASSGVRAALQHDSSNRIPAFQPPVGPGAPVAGAACQAAAGVRAARAELSAGELVSGSYTAAQQQPDADLGRSLRPGAARTRA